MIHSRAGEKIQSVKQARQRARDGKRALAVVASVCGTPTDPQHLSRQEEKLSAAGVILLPSNAQAARLAARLVADSR